MDRGKVSDWKYGEFSAPAKFFSHLVVNSVFFKSCCLASLGRKTIVGVRVL